LSLLFALFSFCSCSLALYPVLSISSCCSAFRTNVVFADSASSFLNANFNDYYVTGKSHSDCTELIPSFIVVILSGYYSLFQRWLALYKQIAKRQGLFRVCISL
jgi:hypothetical protein